MDLLTAPPVEIDTVLADLYYAAARLRMDVGDAIDGLHRAVGDAYVLRFDPRSGWKLGLDAALEECGRRAADESLPGYQRDLPAKAVARYDKAKAGLAANLEAQWPLHEEYDRRPWTRAFLVTNAGGHVHKWMDCSTCFPTTSYFWVTEYSGRDEAEIVEAAGERACTVCYPSAPVATLARPTTIFTPDEVQAAKDREARAAAKVARDAAKAAKAIGPLSVYDWTNPTTGRERFEKLVTLHAAKAWLTDHYECRDNGWGTPKRGEDVLLVLAAVAEKEGKTVDLVAAEATARAKRRK